MHDRSEQDSGQKFEHDHVEPDSGESINHDDGEDGRHRNQAESLEGGLVHTLTLWRSAHLFRWIAARPESGNLSYVGALRSGPWRRGMFLVPRACRFQLRSHGQQPVFLPWSGYHLDTYG